MEKLRSVQVLRAVAACSVVFYHSWGYAHPQGGPLRSTAAGVDLFFVISGFIMANIAKNRTAGRFLFDRFWRIYPIWWIAAVPWLVVASPERIASTLTLWPIYGDFYPPALVIGWTLCFEVLFYAGMALAIRTRPWVPLSVFAVMLPFSSGAGLPGFLGNPLIIEFLLGVWIATLPTNKIGGWLVPLGLVALAFSPASLATLQIGENPAIAVYRTAFWGVPAALIFYGALCLGELRSARWNAPVLLGDASYSIYLFHLPVILLLNLYWVVELGLSVLVGLAMHLVVERRIMRAKPSLALQTEPSVVVGAER